MTCQLSRDAAGRADLEAVDALLAVEHHLRLAGKAGRSGIGLVGSEQRGGQQQLAAEAIPLGADLVGPALLRLQRARAAVGVGLGHVLDRRIHRRAGAGIEAELADRLVSQARRARSGSVLALDIRRDVGGTERG